MILSPQRRVAVLLPVPEPPPTAASWPTVLITELPTAGPDNPVERSVQPTWHSVNNSVVAVLPYVAAIFGQPIAATAPGLPYSTTVKTAGLDAATVAITVGTCTRLRQQYPVDQVSRRAVLMS